MAHFQIKKVHANETPRIVFNIFISGYENRALNSFKMKKTYAILLLFIKIRKTAYLIVSQSFPANVKLPLVQNGNAKLTTFIADTVDEAEPFLMLRLADRIMLHQH